MAEDRKKTARRTRREGGKTDMVRNSRLYSVLMTQHPRATIMGMAMLMLVRLLALVFMGMIMVVTDLMPARFMSALFIAIPGRAVAPFHDGQPRHRDHPPCCSITGRTRRRHIAFAHPPQLGKGAASHAIEFVKWHIIRSSQHAGSPFSPAARVTRIPPAENNLMRMFDYWTIARSVSPLRYLVGPASLMRMSKSKISVGSHKVAQALGISTMPLI